MVFIYLLIYVRMYIILICKLDILVSEGLVDL